MYCMLTLALLVLCGCGRLGFELRDAEGSGYDADDADAVNADGDADDETTLEASDASAEPMPTDAGLGADGSVECASFPPPASGCSTPPAPKLDDLIRAGVCNLPPCSSQEPGLPAGDAYRYDMVTTRSNCGAIVQLIDPFTAVGGRESVVKTLHTVDGSCGFASDETPALHTETFVGRHKAHCDVRPQAAGSSALELSVVEFDSPDHAVGHGRAYVRDVASPCDFDFDIEAFRL